MNLANNSPLDAYNQQANQFTFEILLQNHGWTPASGDRLRWTRPGKDSGTSGVIYPPGGNMDVWSFYSHSSSVDFDTEKALTASALYAMLKHGGNFSAAAKDLSANGYGSRAGTGNCTAQKERQRWVRQKRKRMLQEQRKEQRAERAQSALPALIEKWRWGPEEVSDDSPTPIDEYAHRPGIFLASLFAPFDLVWSGEAFHSGEAHRHRWRTISEWNNAPPETMGPLTAPATWKSGTFSRKRENIAEAPFIVLDFDKIPTTGKEPETQEERKRLVCESLAITRWLREECGWSLSAILWTGSKSLHIWFEMPPEDHIAALKESMATLGIDPSLIGKPEHPARLPGVIHKKTGKRSQTLWLQR